MPMKYILFDIETAPLPESDINNLVPEFEAPGNYKDAEKIKANLAEQRAKWLEKSALSPVTGRVDAIGILRLDQEHPDSIYVGVDEHDERSALTEFWDCVRTHLENHIFIGFNCHKFDLPFLIRRSWKHGVRVPLGVQEGRYFGRNFTDLMESWALGNREERISLGNLAAYLGVGTKEGSGKDFYALPIEAKKAYLTNDLKLTREIARKLLNL